MNPRANDDGSIHTVIIAEHTKSDNIHKYLVDASWGFFTEILLQVSAGELLYLMHPHPNGRIYIQYPGIKFLQIPLDLIKITQ